MSPCYKIICKADIHSRPLSGFYARAVFFSTDPEHDFLVLKPWKTHSVRVFQDVNIVPYFCGIWIDHVPLCTHIYLFFLFQRSVREADVLLTGKNNLWWKQGRGGGGGGRKIYEYANPVTVWNLVMSGKCSRHLSLCRGHCLMPGSWPCFFSPRFPQPLLSSHGNLNPQSGTKQRRAHSRTHEHAEAHPHAKHLRMANLSLQFRFCDFTWRILENWAMSQLWCKYIVRASLITEK